MLFLFFFLSLSFPPRISSAQRDGFVLSFFYDWFFLWTFSLSPFFRDSIVFSHFARAYCERVTSTEAATLAGLERPISSCRACSCMWVTCEASLSGFLFSFVCARTVTTHVMSRCYAVCFLIKENVSSMRLRSFCYFCWMCISVVLNT